MIPIVFSPPSRRDTCAQSDPHRRVIGPAVRSQRRAANCGVWGGRSGHGVSDMCGTCLSETLLQYGVNQGFRCDRDGADCVIGDQVFDHNGVT